MCWYVLWKVWWILLGMIWLKMVCMLCWFKLFIDMGDYLEIEFGFLFIFKCSVWKVFKVIKCWMCCYVGFRVYVWGVVFFKIWKCWDEVVCYLKVFIWKLKGCFYWVCVYYCLGYLLGCLNWESEGLLYLFKVVDLVFGFFIYEIFFWCLVCMYIYLGWLVEVLVMLEELEGWFLWFEYGVKGLWF